jgi:hypothetical protein
MTRKEFYKEKLENNGYINVRNVCDFLRNNCIADYEVIADIFGTGMSTMDYEALQEAINEIEQ